MPNQALKNKGFPPIVDERSRVLILGSMPGQESLAQRKYYAHPRNVFWKVMHSLFDMGSTDSDYVLRVSNLKEHTIALWDVVESCEREGSLDSNIVHQSICLNDFNSLFKKYPGITVVFFNGNTANKLFTKYVMPTLERNNLIFHQLPSTSPAHAGLSIEDKAKRWSVIRKYL